MSEIIAQDSMLSHKFTARAAWAPQSSRHLERRLWSLVTIIPTQVACLCSSRCGLGFRLWHAPERHAQGRGRPGRLGFDRSSSCQVVCAVGPAHAACRGAVQRGCGAAAPAQVEIKQALKLLHHSPTCLSRGLGWPGSGIVADAQLRSAVSREWCCGAWGTLHWRTP